MSPENASLLAQLRTIRQSGLELSDHLLVSAKLLEEQGIAPSTEILELLGNYRVRFEELATGIHWAGTTNEQGLMPSLDELEEELAGREQAIQASQVARDILSITTHDGNSIPEIETIQSEACLLLTSHGRECSPDVIESLLNGQHPWCSLLLLIRERDTLSDAEWSHASRTIETLLGRSLAVAAARGRLVINRVQELSPEPAVQPIPQDSLASHEDPDVREIETVEPQATSSPTEDLQCDFQESDSSLVVHPWHDHVESIGEITHPVSSIELYSSGIETLGVEANCKEVEAPEVVTSETIELISHAAESSDSVFDDIAPVSLQDRLKSESVGKAAPLSEPTKPFASEAPSVVNNVWKPSSPSLSMTGSIFDESDEDDLIRRKSRTPRNTFVPVEPSNPAASISPLTEKLFSEASFEQPSGCSASLAAQIFNGPDAERLTLLPDLILHLIHEGRSGLAYHLAHSLEQRCPERRFVPSWLIRVWTFGHAVLFPKGQLAGLLQEDLKTVHPGNSSIDQDWGLALSLMIRAATLRPAIIAPSCRAAAVLRDFDLKDNCVQLYNYCSRIGTYGERIQGVFPGLFKQTRESVPYADQLSVLRSDIAKWMTADDTVGLKYESSSPLFQKTHWSLRASTTQKNPGMVAEWMSWQAALRYGESLIQPVIDDRRSALSQVRSEVEEVSAKLSSHETEIGQFFHPAVRAYLRQATTFAQRWINLHSGASSSDAPTYLPQAAVELRSEIEDRHDAVIKELQTLADQNQSFEVRMAVSCLMLAVQEIQSLVDPLAPIEAREPDPRHLLSSELLKIPELRLGTNWEPEQDSHAVEDEILKYLCQPQPDWVAAFQMQLAHGNDVAAERILTLSLWTADEIESLEGVLRLHRTRQRSELVRQLGEVRKMLNDTVHLEILPDNERAGIETRLSRLQLNLNNDSGLSSGILEVERVRDLLVKRREREAERIRNRLRLLHGSQAEDEATPPDTSPPVSGWVMDFES